MKTQRTGPRPQITQNAALGSANQAAPKAPTSGAPSPGQVGVLPPVGQIGIPNPAAPAEALNPATLKKAAGVGGAGIHGTGALTGTIGTAMVQRIDMGIASAEERAVLITANAGRDDQVHFVLDIPASSLAALQGQVAEVSGTIDKQTDHVGAIEGAAVGEISGFAPGTYTRLAGRVEAQHNVAIGGEARPSGNWLILDAPIQVAGKKYGDLFLDHAEVAEGARVDLSGRLDVLGFGGVETAPRTYLRLSGVSDVGAGQPLFDGRTFTSSASGKPLDVLTYNRPLIQDVPARIWVLDPGQDKAFAGAQGGFIPPDRNPFHGFSGAGAMRAPTEAERRAVKWDGDTPTNAATGAKLELVEEHGMAAGVADGMAQTWYLDAKADTLYRFLEGGIAGFHQHMDQIIRPGE